MALPFVAHSAAEHYRWLVRSQVRPDGRLFERRMRGPITMPVLQLQGAEDRVLLETAPGSADYCAGPFGSTWSRAPATSCPRRRPTRSTPTSSLAREHAGLTAARG